MTDKNKNSSDFDLELDFDLEEELGIAPFLRDKKESGENPDNDSDSEPDTDDDIYGDDLNDEDSLEEDESEDEETSTLDSESLKQRIESSSNVHESIRDVVFEAVKAEVLGEPVKDEDGNEVDGYTLIKQKRKELWEMLDNLNKHLDGKDMKGVTAVFTSMLDINSQLCTQKTDGVISIRARLYQFFNPGESKANISPAMRQEISLIFSPEEIHAIRSRLADLPDDDPLQPFFTMVLDQAYDVVQYSEMTGYLLLEMTFYFLEKLKKAGYGDSTKVVEFHERHERSKLSLQKAIDDLKNVESLVSRHLDERAVLMELPRLLRLLIQIKLGLAEKNSVQKVLLEIRSRLGDYARARSAVAFDFNRVPSYQHSVRLRQSIILNLQKDVLKYSGEVFEEEFRAIKEEMEKSMAAIEATMEELDASSPEYEEMLKRKTKMQQKLEHHRRKIDVIRSQQKLVDVQHKMVHQAIDRYKANEAQYQKLDEQLAQSTPKIDTTPKDTTPKKRKPSRMVMAGKRR